MIDHAELLRDVQRQPWALEKRCLGMLAYACARLADGADVPKDVLESLGAGPESALQRPRRSGGVAVIPIMGMIRRGGSIFDMFFGGATLNSLSRQLRQAVNDPDIATIVLHVNSPGGVVAGLPEFADEVFAARESKRIIAVADTMSASAAYWIMAQAHEVVVTPSGEVGSIGVFQLHVDESRLLEMEGINPTFIVSQMSPFKTEGNPFEPLTEEATASIQGDVDTFGGMFLKAVARGRGTNERSVRENFGGGRMLLAKEARSAGMVDRVETFTKVMARLGVDLATMDDRRRGEGADDATLAVPPDKSEYGTATFVRALHREKDGTHRKNDDVFVMDMWPSSLLIVEDFCGAGGTLTSRDGDVVRIEVSNGFAEYHIRHEYSGGELGCELGAFEYEDADLSESDSPPPRYAKVGETPGVGLLRCIDEETGQEVPDVVEVDCDEGWVVQHARDPKTGDLLLTTEGGEKTLVTVRSDRNVRLEWAQPKSTAAQNDDEKGRKAAQYKRRLNLLRA